MLLVVQTALELGFLYAPVALALFLSFRVDVYKRQGPRRSPPGEQLVHFTTLLSPCQRLFSLFSTFFNAL